MSDFSQGLFVTTKLQKHLASKDASRVRDYIIHLWYEWPDMNLCPVDHKLIERAVALLDEKGFVVNREKKVIHSFSRRFKDALSIQDECAIRTLLLEIRHRFPVMTDAPVPFELLKTACSFLRDRGWTVDLGKGVVTL